MPEGTAGPGPEGPQPLNPQARADVIDDALVAGRVEDLPSSPDIQNKNSPDRWGWIKDKMIGGNKGNQAVGVVEKPADILDQITTGRVMYVKDEPPLEQAPGQIIDLDEERRKHPSEISDTREVAGVSVKKFRYKGPTILRPEDRGLGTPIDYAGYLIDTPDGSKLLYRSTLGAGVSVKNYDANGNEVSVTTFYGQLGETLARAAETYPPNELPHLIDSAIALSQREHEQLKQKIQAAGGRDKYLLQEAQRLVKEGQYPNVMDAGWAVLSQLEITPTFPGTERLIGEAVDKQELPRDITDQQEINRILTKLFGSTDIMELARLLPEVARLNLDPNHRANVVFNCAKEAMKKLITDNSIVLTTTGHTADGITRHDIAELAQSKFDLSVALSQGKSTALGQAYEYVWRTAAKTEQERDPELILADLRKVGSQKPLGYLDTTTITEYGNTTPEQMINEATARGQKVIVLNQGEAVYHPNGALFVYNEDALRSLLEKNAATLQEAGWSTNPEEFIRKVAGELVQSRTPLFDLVADAFADYGNTG